MNTNKSNWPAKATELTFLLLSILILASRLFFYYQHKLIALAVFSAAIVVSVLAFSFRRRIARTFAATISAYRRHLCSLKNWQMALILFLVSMVTKTAMLLLFDIDSSQHGDIGIYCSFMKELAEGGAVISNPMYALDYPYTLIYSTLFVPVARLFGANMHVYVTYLNVLFSLSSILLFDTIAYCSNKNKAFLCVLAWNLLPSGMIETSMLIHENAFVVLHILAIWLYFKQIPSCRNRWSKACLFILLAVVLAFAYTINQFALVSVIALAMICFTKSVRSLSFFKSVLLCLVSFSVMFGACIGATEVRMQYAESVAATTEEANQNGLFLGWAIYTGSNYNSWGQYDRDDFDRYNVYRDIENREEAIEYQKSLLSERFAWYLASPIRIVKHLFHKSVYIWGKDFNPLVQHNFGNARNTLFKEWKGGVLMWIVRLFLNLFYIAMSIFILISRRIRKKDTIDIANNSREYRTDDFIMYLKLFMMGCTVILLCVEVTQKYASHMLFCFITVGLFALFDIIKQKGIANARS